MNDKEKLLVYHASFYVYGSIVAYVGLREIFSGNFGTVPALLSVIGVGLALLPGCRLYAEENPREYLPSDRTALVLGGAAAVSIASVVLTVG